MSRSGYSENLDNWDMIKWRGQVASAARGKRGQSLLYDMVQALDSMTDKSLITGELVTDDGEVCALGAVAVARGIDLRKIDPEEWDDVADVFDVAPQLVEEVAWMNDEWWSDCSPEDRHKRMRAWAVSRLSPNSDMECR